MRGDNVNGHAALRIRREEGLTFREIGERLNMTEAAVWNAMRRARQSRQAQPDDERRITQAERDARLESQRVFRDACTRCAVPADRHDTLGCKRFVHL